MTFSFGFPPDPPAIMHAPRHGAALADDPDKWRWRAELRSHPDGSAWIEVTFYHVVKRTPCGAWIERDSDYGEPIRVWVSDTGSSAFAKRTRQEAIDSAAIRTARYVDKTCRRLRELAARVEAITALVPHRAHLIQEVEYATRQLEASVAAARAVAPHKTQ